MAIATLDQLVAAAKQNVNWTKTGARTMVAASWFSLTDVAGQPGAGTLAAPNTAAGTVPDDTLTGYPAINTFGGSAKGYLSRVEFACSVACRLQIFDRLFHAGAYAFNAAVTLASQPSFAARVPNTDYKGLELWIECVTAFTGNPTIAVTYTNQDGTTGRTTGAINLGFAPTQGRMYQMQLQAGDTGIQKIESVTATVATVGTFNVLVLRPLWVGRVRMANDGDTHDFLRTGMPEVYDTSCFMIAAAADATALGSPDVNFQIASA